MISAVCLFLNISRDESGRKLILIEKGAVLPTCSSYIARFLVTQRHRIIQGFTGSISEHDIRPSNPDLYTWRDRDTPDKAGSCLLLGWRTPSQRRPLPYKLHESEFGNCQNEINKIPS
ncbi:hypothetical protein CEXT_275121 [Caerostris extrusa]|uniref:Uncharacterized protein n=1 Tax=Caerostris extrusa TaxID=172846 RepID=A0AAV4SSD7_CAEEX|nr:hypothetical protein CEXT_275121 [Caerostris extrusa]